MNATLSAPSCRPGQPVGRLLPAARRAIAACLMGGLVSLFPAPARAESVLKTKHNLSSRSTADIRAVSETDACKFCHTPHHSSREVPLWGHVTSGVTYKTYSSSTTKAQIGQPNGSSKACLSCHDGTIALGMLRGRATPVPMQNRVTTMPSGKAAFGTDLSGHHPVSFVYDQALVTRNGQLKDPVAFKGKVRIDRSKQMQCTSCHDPHNDQFGNFLVQDNTASALCLNCHSVNNWASSAHATSSRSWNGTGLNPWPNTTNNLQKSVAANACGNCHATHQAGSKARLLQSNFDELNCYPCHNGNVAAKNVAAEFTKPSAHPVTLSHGTHDEAENVLTISRHATCSDCHNPHMSVHATTARSAVASAAPPLSPALAGARGLNAAGTVVPQISYEYELCYRCHADSAGKAQAKLPRQFSQTNARLQFNPGNSSFHPVQGLGRNTSVPSLILPWRTNSRMLCTDCHNNDQGPNAGGSGPNGPHGSAYSSLLERQLQTVDFQAETAMNYALCYKCHDRGSILADQSFVASNSKGQPRGHRFHIVDQHTACTTCHDPHGVATAKHLINFNTAYVLPSASGRLDYTSGLPGSGNCTLTCHGKDHAATPYSNGMVPSLRRPR